MTHYGPQPVDTQYMTIMPLRYDTLLSMPVIHSTIGSTYIHTQYTVTAVTPLKRMMRKDIHC